MPETIETFVKKLQDDGVAAGKAKADELLAVATAEADKLKADAQAQADKIIAEAQAEAQRVADAQGNELRLAARDSLLKLRESIVATLEAVLKQQASATMKDAAFLKQLITTVVTQYAKDDAAGAPHMTVNVNEEAFAAVGDWAVGALSSDAVDLKGGLKAAGFEYSVADSTVEVTLDAVVEVLRAQVSPRLQGILQDAAKQ